LLKKLELDNFKSISIKPYLIDLLHDKERRDKIFGKVFDSESGVKVKREA